MFPNFIQLLKLVAIMENWLPIPVSHKMVVMIAFLAPRSQSHRAES